MTQTQTKIEGKFYPLQQEEWLRACRELTPAEIKVLYYIRTADPYSNGVRLTAAAIARDLSCEGQPPVSRQTVSRAIKSLDKLGYIDMEPLEFNVRLCGKGVLVCQHTDGVSAHHDGSSHTDSDRYTPTAIATHQSEQLEPPPCSRLDDSPSTKINKDLVKTLLEAERERNLSFWISLNEEEQSELIAIAGSSFLPKLEVQPTLPLKWIQYNCLEIAKFSGIDKYCGNPLDRENLWSKKEWEAEPGVPYPALEEERIGYWVHKGEPIETATAKARAELRNPVVAKDLWDGFLRKCDRLADDALKAKNQGVETPYLPPSFTEKSPITKESVSAKLGAIAPQFCLESSAEADADAESEIETLDDSPPTAEALNKSCITDAGRKFVEGLIAKNPQWNYEIVRGQVVEKDGVW